MTNPIQSFWYLLSQLGRKEEYLKVLAPHGVTSFSHLSVQKQEELIDELKAEWNNRSKRPRGAIIHYLCIMPWYSYKRGTGDPHYEKIDEWCKAMFKKPLNQLTLSELNKAVSAVKAWYNKQLKAKK